MNLKVPYHFSYWLLSVHQNVAHWRPLLRLSLSKRKVYAEHRCRLATFSLKSSDFSGIFIIIFAHFIILIFQTFAFIWLHFCSQVQTVNCVNWQFDDSVIRWLFATFGTANSNFPYCRDCNAQFSLKKNGNEVLVTYWSQCGPWTKRNLTPLIETLGLVYT